jgi:hypothetical protein
MRKWFGGLLVLLGSIVFFDGFGQADKNRALLAGTDTTTRPPAGYFSIAVKNGAMYYKGVTGKAIRLWDYSAGGPVSSILGTANQITASSSFGAVTLSLPSTVVLGTSVRVPLVVGGSAVNSALTLRSTTASGTSDYIAFLTGNGVERMRINTSGQFLTPGSTGYWKANGSSASTFSATIPSTDLSGQLAATQVGANTNVSNTEYSYLDGVGSAIQTQLDAKAPLASPTLTGTPILATPKATSLRLADQTAQPENGLDVDQGGAKLKIQSNELWMWLNPFAGTGDEYSRKVVAYNADGTITLPGTGYGYGNGSGSATFSTTIPSTAITGVFPESKGGTNQSTYATGDFLYSSATNVLSKRTIGSTGQVLRVTGGLPLWATFDYATDGTNTLPVNRGGTGIATLSAGRIPYGNGTGAFSSNAGFGISSGIYGTTLYATNTYSSGIIGGAVVELDEQFADPVAVVAGGNIKLYSKSMGLWYRGTGSPVQVALSAQFGATANQVSIGAAGNSTTGSNNLWFTGSNLGINTNSPNVPLHVVGKAKITDSTYFGGNVLMGANSKLSIGSVTVGSEKLGVIGDSKFTGTLDVLSGGTTLRLGADDGASTRTTNTTKSASLSGVTYSNGATPFTIAHARSASSNHFVYIGGGLAGQYAANQVSIYTGGTNTTDTGTERLTVLAGGNVGINHGNPSYQLEVAGNFRNTTDAYFATTSGGVGIGTTTANAPLQFSNATVNRKIVLFENTNNDHQFIGLGVNGGVFRYQVNATSVDNVWYAGTSSSASTELMRIKGTGEVGIGISPNVPLHVYKASTTTAIPVIYAETNGTGGRPSIQLRAENSVYGTFGFTTTAGENMAITNSRNGTLFLSTNGNTAINIATNGNIATGAFTPNSKLDVNGDLTLSGGQANNIVLKASTDVASTMRWDISGLTTAAANFQVGRQTSGTANLSFSILKGDNTNNIQTNFTGFSNSYINALAGNLFVGATTGVAEKLSVTGNIYSTGKEIFDATMTAGGTTGNQTINKPSGSVNFAAAATSITVTNSFVTVNSIIAATVMTNDGTAYVKNVVPGSGSFVITLGAAATGETKVGFVVAN